MEEMCLFASGDVHLGFYQLLFSRYFHLLRFQCDTGNSGCRGCKVAFVYGI